CRLQSLRFTPTSFPLAVRPLRRWQPIHERFKPAAWAILTAFLRVKTMAARSRLRNSDLSTCLLEAVTATAQVERREHEELSLARALERGSLPGTVPVGLPPHAAQSGKAASAMLTC